MRSPEPSWCRSGLFIEGSSESTLKKIRSALQDLHQENVLAVALEQSRSYLPFVHPDGWSQQVYFVVSCQSQLSSLLKIGRFADTLFPDLHWESKKKAYSKLEAVKLLFVERFGNSRLTGNVTLKFDELVAIAGLPPGVTWTGKIDWSVPLKRHIWVYVCGSPKAAEAQKAILEAEVAVADTSATSPLVLAGS